MQISFGLLLEMMVLVLLATTVGYCYILNKKLQNLRGDEQLLRQTIRELCVSIDSAERAVDHLRKTAMEREQALQGMITSADEAGAKLRAAQAETHETLTLIQQQTNFALDIANRLKHTTHQAQTRGMAVDIAPQHYETAVGEPVKRRPFNFNRDAI